MKITFAEGAGFEPAIRITIKGQRVDIEDFVLRTIHLIYYISDTPLHSSNVSTFSRVPLIINNY